MIKQNVTLSLPRTLIRKAKLVAVQEEKSFNELVRQCLEQRLSKTANYTKARDRQIGYSNPLDLGTAAESRLREMKSMSGDKYSLILISWYMLRYFRWDPA